MTINKRRKNEIIFNNCEHFPKTVFGLISGPTYAGKRLLTNFLIGFCELHQQDLSDFERLIFVSPLHIVRQHQLVIESFKNDLPKPIIRKLEIQNTNINYSKDIRHAIFEMKHKKVVDVQCYADPKTLPPPENINKDKKKTLIIFEDCTIIPQSTIENFYLCGNNLGIECILLTNSLFQIQKRIRNQCNYFILFKTSLKDLKNIYGQMGAKNFKRFKDFKKYCEESWGNKGGYVIINKSNLQAMPNQNRSITLEV